MEKKRKLRSLSGIFHTAMIFSVILFVLSIAYNGKTKSDFFQFLFPTGTFFLLMLNVILVIIIRRRLEIHNDKTQCIIQGTIRPPATYSNPNAPNPAADLMLSQNGILEINVTPIVHLAPSAPDFPMFPQDREYPMFPLEYPMFPRENPIFPQDGSSLGYVNQSFVGCKTTGDEFDRPPSYESSVEDPPSYFEAIKY